MSTNPYTKFKEQLDKLMGIRREIDQTKMLLKLQEDTIPLLTETIPHFNRFCGFLLNFLPDTTSINAICVVNILQTILNGFPNKYYYILRVVQVIAAGLLNSTREVKAAFLKQLAEVLAAAETNPEILKAVCACSVPIVQGIIVQPDRDANCENMLINAASYQGVFLQIIGRTDAFLRVVDDLIGKQETFASLCQLVRAQNTISACALEKIQYYAGKMDDASDYDKLTLSLIFLLNRDFDANDKEFYRMNLPYLILQAFEVFEIQRSSAPLLIPYLRIAHLRREADQFAEKFDRVLNMLEDVVKIELEDKKNAGAIDCLLFAQYLDDILECGIVYSVIAHYLLYFIYDQMFQTVKARSLCLKSSQEYQNHAESIRKFRETVEKLMVAEQTRKYYYSRFYELVSGDVVFIFTDTEQNTEEGAAQLSEEQLQDAEQRNDELLAEVEQQYQLVCMVLDYFGVQFFPSKLYLRCCNTKSDAGQITGEMIILMALQKALVETQDIQHFKKHFTDHTFVDLIMHPQAQQNELQRVLLLRIMHLLLERSSEIVSTDWFAKQQEYREFVQFLLHVANSQELHYIEGYGFQVADFLKSLKLISYQNPSVESFEFYVEGQALLLLSYLSNFLQNDLFANPSEEDLDGFLQTLLTNCTSFSQAISFSAAIIIGQLCYNKSVMERIKAILFDCNEEFEQVNLVMIQNLVSFIPVISIIYRMRSGEYKKQSSVAAAPLVPLVNEESCQQGLKTVESLKRCLLLNNFEQKEGLVKLQNLNNRFQKLNYKTDKQLEETRKAGQAKLQVDNIMMHPVTPEFADVVVLSPLQYLVNSTTFLKVICNQIIFEIVKLEPELLIGAIESFVSAAQTSVEMQNLLEMPNMSMSMSENSVTYLKQKEAARLMKVVLGTNGFVIQELSFCVTEYIQQAIQKYTSLSSIDVRGQAMIMGFMDLLYNSSLASLDTNHEKVIKLITNFKYEQIQDIKQYIFFVSQRIQILESLNPLKDPNQGLDEDIYEYWLHSFDLLLKYTVSAPRENDPSCPLFGGKIHQFFSIFFKFNQLNLEHIVEVLMRFLEPRNYCQKNVMVIFAMFLQNFNTLVKQKIKYRTFPPDYSSKLEIFDGRISVRLFATFLQIVLFVALQYGQQFQDVCWILEDELRDNSSLLYGLFFLIQLQHPLKGQIEFAVDKTAEKPKFTSKQYQQFSTNIQQIFERKLHFYQPRFIQLIYSYNSSHALPEDPEQLFKQSMKDGNILMLLFLLNWKINQLDIGQRDAIVELVGEQLEVLNQGNKDQVLQQKRLIFLFLHELQLENQQINFSIVNKYYTQIYQIIVDLFQGLCERRISDRQDYNNERERVPEIQRSRVEALDVELGGEVVCDFKTFMSCDLNTQTYEYDLEIYDIFKSYPYSFSRCLFEMGRAGLVQQLYKELFSIFRGFSVQQQDAWPDRSEELEKFGKTDRLDTRGSPDDPNRPKTTQKPDPTSLALLDQIINIGRIPVDFSLPDDDKTYLYVLIDKNSDLEQIHKCLEHEILSAARTRHRIVFADGTNAAPLVRRLIWVCAEICTVPPTSFKALEANVSDLALHSDRAYRYYQMQIKHFQEFMLPLSFRMQFLKKPPPEIIQQYISAFQQIVFAEFKMALESAYYCARTRASESRQTRMMAIPYLALQLQWPREFAQETLKIAVETWEIDPVARSEQWFVQWREVPQEPWECVVRYANARAYLMLFKFD